MSKPKAFDLFAGCGGLTEGLKQAQFEVVGAVELDALAVETYKMNHGEVTPFPGDIRELSPKRILKSLGLKKGELSLLAGCPPCQGFSSHRTRNKASSVNDLRNDLLYEFARFVKDMMPKAVMMENVPGLADDKRMRLFKAEMQALGYEGDVRILNASDFGIPQRRRRMVYLAGLGGEVPIVESTGETKTVRERIGALPIPGESGDPLHDITENRSHKIKTLITWIPKDGGSRSDLPDNLQLSCHRRCNGYKDVYGRMRWDDVAPTITGGCINPSKGRFLHPEQNRSITLREAALLQDFPENYKFSMRRGKFPAAEMIGNAFPPGFAKCQAEQVRRFLGE